jgi:hypothetical protein
MLKLYYVKREVIASTVSESLKKKGHVYAVELSEEKYWPSKKNKQPTGFKSNDKKS